MEIEKTKSRELGTMIAYGFDGLELRNELILAQRLGAQVLEILPDWRTEPDPVGLREQVANAGLRIHSAHGCWGGQSIRAERVDLGHLDPKRHREGVDDLRRCLDWLDQTGGRCLVVHPGGLSSPDVRSARRDALARGLLALLEHARGMSITVCVENMPPGVHPGTRMAELADLVAEIDHPKLALALDTGHAHISHQLDEETLAAGRWLRTTHVHDNNGRQDSHDVPGGGTVDWPSWGETLDRIDYQGPIMLECVRQFRKHPDLISPALLERLRSLTTIGRQGTLD